MCAIYGSLGKNYKEIGATFSKYLQHRGPDGNGVYYDHPNSLSLGHNRLSIIDLSNNANQPMINENETHILTYNGEIYNYKEIKKELICLGHNFITKSDSEVVLKSFMHWGEDCLEKFRGMFALCIYNKQNGTLFLARDRFGIKPLIYTFLDDQFNFFSELKPVLLSRLLSKKLSQSAVNDFFKYGSVQQPNTILEGIYHLMPGHSMTVTLGGDYEIKRYYNYLESSKRLPKVCSYKEAVKKVRAELEVATMHHMVADVDVGVFLSGGIDSTAVAALMRHCSGQQINTFSVGFKNKTYVEDETDIASRTAKQLGCNHQNIKIDDAYIKNIFDDFIQSMDQPTIDGINSFIISLEVSKEIKVALSGLGGDEIFAGYSHFATISNYSMEKSGLISSALKTINTLRPNSFTNKYEFIGADEEISLDKKRALHKTTNAILKNHVIDKDHLICAELTSIQRISRAEIDNYMLNTLLRDGDVLSMAHSLEVRPILLDHKLVELAFSLDDSFKVREGIHKSVFVDSVKDIIPAEVWKRQKAGFEMPFLDWMNGGLNQIFTQVVYHPLAYKVIKRKYLKDAQERASSCNLKTVDWMLLIFLSWLDKYEIEI